MRKIVTVFGSSVPRPGEEEYETAYSLGFMLGKKGFNVCTGGYQGIMDAVSKGAREAGTDAIGITVDVFGAAASAHLTEEIKTESLLERIEYLVKHGDAYIILPGGTGTLVELAVVWEMMNKKIIKEKPAACFGKMWKPMLEAIEKRILFEKRKPGLVRYFDSIEDCGKYIFDCLN